MPVEQSQKSLFCVKKATVEKFANFEREQGAKIIQTSTGYWRQVRPFFFRPLLPFREYSAASISPPVAGRFGGVQFAVSPGQSPNSFLNLLMFPEAGTYSLAALESKRRWEVRSAAKVFSVRQVTDVNEFKEKAFSAYLSFYQRTRYQFKSERQNAVYFAQWAESLFKCDSFLILGAYRGGQLEAISISQWIEDTVFYSTAFCHQAALRLNVNSLMLHSIREAAAQCPEIKQIFAGMYKHSDAHGVDDFYLLRGCQLLHKPACLKLNLIAGLLLRAFRRGEQAKIIGNLDPTVLNGNSDAPSMKDVGMGGLPSKVH